jgi:hypothetical protein
MGHCVAMAKIGRFFGETQTHEAGRMLLISYCFVMYQTYQMYHCRVLLKCEGMVTRIRFIA